VATIKEIAKLAGVSHATVSKVLAGESVVSRHAAVRRAENIRRIADELGYRPDFTAQSLRNGKTGLVAVLGSTPLSLDDHNQEAANILRRVARLLRDRGLNLSAQLCDRAEKNATLPPWKVDAAILVEASSRDQTSEVEKFGIPYVAFNGECGNQGSAVEFDDRHGIRLAVDGLHDAGHHRIAYLSNYQTFEHKSVSIRLDEYGRYLDQIGLPALPTYRSGEVGENDVQEHLQHLIDDHGCTAIICWDPWVALYAYRAAQAIGLQLPRDLSVVAFNDTPLGREALQPRLSAVTRPVEKSAEALVELLTEQLSDGSVPPRKIMIKPRLITRESIAEPKPWAV